MPSLKSDYEILESIGTGTYGTCKKIRRKRDGKLLAWKEIDYSNMSEKSKQMLVVEVNLLRQLRHEFIVRYYDRVIDKSISTLYIVMEYCEGGDLASYIRKMKTTQSRTPEVFVWQTCYQISSALLECHSRVRNGNMVLHRDLKPANVFLDAHNNVKIGDFGLARILQPDISYTETYVGTPYYMSPEQLLGEKYNGKCDSWSLGVILYEMCALKPPFMADSQIDLINKVTSGRVQRIPAMYSDDLWSIVCLLLETDPDQRYSIDQILLHPALLSRCKSSTLPSGLPVNEHCAASLEALQAREMKLCSRENAVAEQEASLELSMVEVNKRLRELDDREKNVISREKMADERMARAERLMKEYAELKLQLITKSSPLESSSDSNLCRHHNYHQCVHSDRALATTDCPHSRSPTLPTGAAAEKPSDQRMGRKDAGDRVSARRVRCPSTDSARKSARDVNHALLRHKQTSDYSLHFPSQQLDPCTNVCLHGRAW